MMLTSGRLRVTDEHQNQRCDVVIMLVDHCYDNCAASPLTCFRGFPHHNMTRLVLFCCEIIFVATLRTFECEIFRPANVLV